MEHRKNRNGTCFDAVEDRERETTNLGSTDVARPRRIETRVCTNPGPTRFDLTEKVRPESALLKFVPEELGLQLEFGAPTDT